MKIRAWFTRNKGLIFEALIILFVALIPRLNGIGLFMTADEKNWLSRSNEYIKAWRHLRINDTLQTTHPGITVMFVAGLAVYVAQLFYHMVFDASITNGLLRFAVFAQVSMAIINALLVVGIFLALRRLLPRFVAIAAGLVLALDPYLIGFSKIVHVDAFLTGFLTLAVLLLLAYDKTKNKKIFYLAGVFAALAILTKLPAIAVFPFVFCLLFFRKDIFSKKVFIPQLKLFVYWLLFVGAIVILLWPSLWWVPHPLDNITQVQKDMTVATLQPHDMDEPYTMAVWHYPATLLARLTIPVELGIVLLVAMLVFHQSRAFVFRVASKRMIFFLLLFVLIFMIEMTIGAKKGDRYVLPVFPAVMILGTVGICAATSYLFKERGTKITIATVAGAVIFIPIIFSLVKLGPYDLAYYNPLFPPNLSQELGWGEGFDQVAKYLDAQPDKNYVASWYPEELGALTKKTVQHVNAHLQNRVGYVVLYRNMFGRSSDHWANDFIDEYYKKRTPVFVAHVNGLEYAWVYKKPVVNAIVGEILPGQAVVVKETLKADNLSAVSVAVATYSGKAKAGSMTLHIKTDLALPDLRTVTIDTGKLQDGGLTKFSFEPLSGVSGREAYFIFTTNDTYTGNAPTLRVAKDEPNASYSWIKQGSISDKNFVLNTRSGWVGIDWFFIRDGKEISQLEVK